jgi:26S proteasome regulatory subunit N3
MPDAIDEAIASLDEEREKKEVKPVEVVLTPRERLVKDIRSSVLLLTDAVQKRDRRLQTRALGGITSIRRRLQLSVLKENLGLYYKEGEKYLVGMKEEAEPEPMEVDAGAGASEDIVDGAAAATPTLQEKKEKKVSEEEKKLAIDAVNLHEVKLYFHLLIALYLADKARMADAASCVDDLLTLLHSQNRRSSDLLSAKVYFYYSFFNERLGKLESIRGELLGWHRSACLAHNEPGQATLVVSILRNYLAFNLISQADNFRMKIRFPENCSNNLAARYLFYLGRIESVQLNYSDAFANLTQAIRKVPLRKETAGFRLSAYKLLIIVQLLMGELPERSVFGQTGLREALAPYFELTKAVRIGDLSKFAEVMSTENRKQFIADNTFSLIIRLRHNVIKTVMLVCVAFWVRKLLSPGCVWPMRTVGKSFVSFAGSSQDQPLLLKNFNCRYLFQTSARKSGRRGIHCCKGHS